MVGPTRFKDSDFDPSRAAKEEAPTGEGAGFDAAKQLLNHLAELSNYASYYVGAQLDATKLTIRNLFVYAALGVLGLIVSSGLLVTAAVLLLQGAAQGIGELLGDRLWAGNLIVGAVVLLLVGLAAYLGLAKMTKASRQTTVEKYEQRKREQRQKFGHDVSTRATASSE